LFALDVTKPDDVKLLWEYDSSTDSDLGYTFSKPTVARLHSGQWAVVTGNGYGSDNDKAALLLIDLKKGTLIKKLEVQSERGIANGLSTPRLADNNSDGIADYA
ncbi:PilC/PilY family type IV pilus protein, partial [Pseudomonas aeruginosa]